MKRGNYILWLPSWYPNRLDPFNGDFIQRHAQAVSLFEEVEVIYLVRDSFGMVTKTVLVEENKAGNLTETIIYYYSKTFFYKPYDKINSFVRYNKIYRQLIEKKIFERGLPSLVHLYIALNAGFVISWIKRKYHIKYVVTEQWTAYLTEAKPNISELPFFLRLQLKKIFNNASGVSVVSKYLGKALIKLGYIKSFIVIPNVVNTKIFNYQNTDQKNSKVNFLHISLLNYQKNPKYILEAFALVKKDGFDFQLTMVGPAIESVMSLIHELDLKDKVVFFYEMVQQELVKLMKQADAFVLYSRYETFGCVLIEANACGIPVIVSDIPVFHENIVEGFNGTFVKNEDTKALAEKIIWFIDNKANFSSFEISTAIINKFNFNAVGRQFSNWYKQILNQKVSGQSC